MMLLANLFIFIYLILLNSASICTLKGFSVTSSSEKHDLKCNEQFDNKQSRSRPTRSIRRNVEMEQALEESATDSKSDQLSYIDNMNEKEVIEMLLKVLELEEKRKSAKTVTKGRQSTERGQMSERVTNGTSRQSTERGQMSERVTNGTSSNSKNYGQAEEKGKATAEKTEEATDPDSRRSSKKVKSPEKMEKGNDQKEKTTMAQSKDQNDRKTAAPEAIGQEKKLLKGKSPDKGKRDDEQKSADQKKHEEQYRHTMARSIDQKIKDTRSDNIKQPIEQAKKAEKAQTLAKRTSKSLFDKADEEEADYEMRIWSSDDESDSSDSESEQEYRKDMEEQHIKKLMELNEVYKRREKIQRKKMAQNELKKGDE